MTYYFDIKNLDADTQGALITAVQAERIPTDEAIARAHSWLNKAEFMALMEWWKTYDYQPIICAKMDADYDNLIVAIEKDCFATVITTFEIK